MKTMLHKVMCQANQIMWSKFTGLGEMSLRESTKKENIYNKGYIWWFCKRLVYANYVKQVNKKKNTKTILLKTTREKLPYRKLVTIF